MCPPWSLNTGSRGVQTSLHGDVTYMGIELLVNQFAKPALVFTKARVYTSLGPVIPGMPLELIANPIPDEASCFA